MDAAFPKISVVTVCYNAVTSIEVTINSVLNQTYSNLEYIIIDGQSKDGTVDLIKKYSDNLSLWVSEPDKGIYDAMNKGIEYANGLYIIFLNAGDYFYSKNSINKVFENVDSIEADVLYGDVAYKFSYGMYHKHILPIETFDKGMPIAHPATFVKAELIKFEKFNVKYKIAADYDMLYRLYKEGRNFKYVNAIITVFEAETGVSSTRYMLAKKECSLINHTYGSKQYYKKIIVLYIKRWLNKVLATFFKTYSLKRKIKKTDCNAQYKRLL
jgi:glycosyltransferase involved in cell wall biosynthesis